MHHKGVLVGGFHALHNLVVRGDRFVAVQAGEIVVGVEHVGGIEGIAVVEGDALAQVEGVGQAVLGDIPAFGQAGDDLAVFIVQAQALEDVVHNGLGVRGGRLPGVQAVGLRANVHPHHGLFAAGLAGLGGLSLGGGRAFRAAAGSGLGSGAFAAAAGIPATARENCDHHGQGQHQAEDSFLHDPFSFVFFFMGFSTFRFLL